MVNYQVQAEFSVVDKASGPSRTLAKNIGLVGTEALQTDKSLDRLTGAQNRNAASAQKAASAQSRFAQSAGGLKASLLNSATAATAGAIGFTAIVGGAAKAITAASDLNETMNKSRVIFGAQHGAMEKWADGSVNALGMSKAAALDAASGFSDMFQQIGFGREQAAAMSQQIVQMSADFGSFNNLPTEDVAQRIRAAFRGEYESLQTLIPTINAATVEQEAMSMTGKKNAAALTTQEKAAAVLKIVNEGGARAQGDFARTSDDAANAQKKAAAEIENLAAEVGQKLLPAWKNLLGFTNSTVLPGLSGVVDVAGDLLGAIGGLPGPIKAVATAFVAWKIAGPAISGVTSQMTSSIASRVRAFGDAVAYAGAASAKAGGGFRGAAAGLKTFTGGSIGMKGALSGVMGVLGGPWGVAIMGASALLSVFMGKQAETKSKVDEMTDALKKQGPAGLDAARKILALDINKDEGLLGYLKDVGISVPEYINAITQGGDAAVEMHRKIQEFQNQNPFEENGSGQKLQADLNERLSIFEKSTAAIEAEKKATEDAAAAAEKSAPGIEKQATAQKSAADTAKEAAENTDKFANAVRGLGSAVLDERESIRSYEEALDNADKVLKENGKTLDVHTEKGRANQAALDGIVESGLGVAEAHIKSGGSIDDASKIIARTRKDFVDHAVKLGMSRDKANELADKMQLTNDRVRQFAALKIPVLKFMADNSDVLYKISQVQTKMAGIPGWVGVATTVAGVVGTTYKADGGIDARGRRVERVPQIVKGGRYVLWGEDETRDEAYISRKPGMERRNIGVLETAASWFGLQLQKAADGYLGTRDLYALASGGPMPGTDADAADLLISFS